MENIEYSLICKAIRGNAEACGELVQKYNPYFYKIAFLYVRNEDDALEIVQDCLSGVFENQIAEKSGIFYHMDDTYYSEQVSTFCQ